MDVLVDVVTQQHLICAAEVEFNNNVLGQLATLGPFTEEHHVATPSVTHHLMGQTPRLGHLNQLVDLL